MTDRLNPEALDRGREAVAEVISETTYTCSRVWEAWHYGTMTDEDFSPAWEDGVLLTEVVQAVLAALPEPDSTLITDELTRVAEALHGYDCPDDPEPGEACTCDGDTYYRMAEVALEAAALPTPRTIETVEELDALPVGAVVYAANHIGPAERFTVGWMGCGSAAAWSSAVLARDGLPATVLHVPTEGGGE